MSAIVFKTPTELWSRHLAKCNNLKVFGCITFVHFKDGRLQLRALKYIFLGYPDGVKGYKCWNPISEKCIISHDVIFREEEFPMMKGSKEESSPKRSILSKGELEGKLQPIT